MGAEAGKSMEPAPCALGSREAWFAAHLLERAVRGCSLPAPIPGEPNGLNALVAANAATPDLFRALSAVFHEREWGYEAFRDKFARGVLAAWKPGSSVEEGGGTLRITSPACPIAELRARDPRVCQMCRCLQEGIARLAMPGQVESLGFTCLPGEGRGACEMILRRRKGE